MQLFQQIGLGVVIVLLALILIFVLVAVIFIVRILRSVKHISARAEETTASFADIASMVGKKVAPLALSTAAAAALRRLRRK
jgi:hypothetical protein